ncbi:hypothetical protein ACVWZW_006960 [Bradyrhizobium sp. F1.13.4]
MITVNFDSIASPANRPAASHQRPWAALRKPHQAPHHRHRKRDHGDIGRNLRHQQAVIERGFRHQYREHDGAHIMGEAADDVGEQELRHQHRDDAAEAHTERGVAEDHSAEPDQPGDAGGMIQEAERRLLRPRPVIGLVRTQLDGGGVDHAQQRHRSNDRRGHDERPARRAYGGHRDVGSCRHGGAFRQPGTGESMLREETCHPGARRSREPGTHSHREWRGTS